VTRVVPPSPPSLGDVEPIVLRGLPADVTLVHVDVCGPARPDDLALLSPDERARAARFHRERDRDRYVTARAALRRLLADRVGRSPGDLAFVESGRGKPVLAGGGSHFSVTHAGAHAVLAVADGPVGVDVELVRPESWDHEMAALVLSWEERCWVREHADPDVAFFRCWTRKEAYVKLGSDGLVDELRSRTLTPVPDRSEAVVLVDAPLAPGVHVACAVAGRGGAP
jgi:4'-phosphopantetheinyl transferase